MTVAFSTTSQALLSLAWQYKQLCWLVRADADTARNWVVDVPPNQSTYQGCCWTLWSKIALNSLQDANKSKSACICVCLLQCKSKGLLHVAEHRRLLLSSTIAARPKLSTEHKLPGPIHDVEIPNQRLVRALAPLPYPNPGVIDQGWKPRLPARAPLPACQLASL